MKLTLTRAELIALDYLFFSGHIETPKGSRYCTPKLVRSLMRKVYDAASKENSKTKSAKRGAK